jgi:hypothetical protein
MGVYMKIEIHGTAADGTPYRLNTFRQNAFRQNASLGSPGTERYEAFRRSAKRDAQVWQRVFPDDVVRVVEVRDAPGRVNVTISSRTTDHLSRVPA